MKTEDHTDDFRVVRPKSPWAKIVKVYLESWRSRKLSKRTRQSHESVLRIFFQECRGDISRALVKRHLRWLEMERGLRPISANANHAKLRAFFKWARESRLIDFNPVLGIAPPQLVGKLPTTLSHLEFESLYDEARIDPLVSTQDLMMLELFYGTGIKEHELRSVRIGDIDFERATISISGRNKRFLPVPGLVLKHLRDYISSLRIRTSRQYTVFRNRVHNPVNHGYVYKRMSHILRKRLPKGKGSRTMRHTFARVLFDRDCPFSGVQGLLGLRQARSAISYCEPYDITRLQRDYLAHPRNSLN
jgi:site-specific recombinase XerD